MSDSIKSRLKSDMVVAMKAKDKDRLATIRLLNAAIKQIEIDEKKDLNDADVLALLDKQAKQRRESIKQFLDAGREELAKQEQDELEIIQTYLPEQLSEAELAKLVSDAVAESQAASMQDMGKVMAILKPKVQGRCDMGAMSKLVKDALAG